MPAFMEKIKIFCHLHKFLPILVWCEPVSQQSDLVLRNYLVGCPFLQIRCG